MGNLLPERRSKLSSINLLCVTKSQTLTHYGCEAVLGPIMKDINTLEKVFFYNLKILTYNYRMVLLSLLMALKLHFLALFYLFQVTIWQVSYWEGTSHWHRHTESVVIVWQLMMKCK